jgi:hypothetical protein
LYLDELMDGLAGCFARVEPRRQARRYATGLISDLSRKNCWALAEQAGDQTPDRMQRLLERAAWDAGEAMRAVREFAVRRLGDPAGAVLVLANPATGVRGIHHHIVTSLGGRPAHGTASLTAQAYDVLAGEAAERGRVPVLIIDEAHLLTHEQLESIRMLTLCRDRDYAGGPPGMPWRPRSRVRRGRHNHRASRNARSLSGGRYLPVFVFGDSVRARAFSLSLRSAWM